MVTRPEMGITFVVLFLLTSPLLGCYEPQVPRDVLNADCEIIQTADSTFFGTIRSIVHDSDKWYLCDDTAQTVLVIEHSMDELIRRIGGSGEGPGEFQSCRSVYVRGDSVYVYDARNQRLQVFDAEGRYAGGITTERLNPGFVVSSNGTLFASMDFSNPPLARLTRSGNIEHKFGSILIPSESEIQNQLRSKRHIKLLPDGRLLTVGVSYPVVEIVDTDGNVDTALDLSTLPLFERAVEESTSRWRRDGIENLTVTVIKDVAVVDDDILLLVWEGPEAYHHVLRISIQEWAPVEYYDIRDPAGHPLSWPYALALSEDGRRFIIYDGQRGSIFVYTMPSPIS